MGSPRAPAIVFCVGVGCSGSLAGRRDAEPPCVEPPRARPGAAVVYGIVLDERGRAIPRVLVTATGQEAGEVGDVLGEPILRLPPPRPAEPPGPHTYTGVTDPLGQYWLSLRDARYDVELSSPDVLVRWRNVVATPGRALRLDVDLGELPADDWGLELDATRDPTVSTRTRPCRAADRR